MAGEVAQFAFSLRRFARRRVALCRCVRVSPSVQLVERQDRHSGDTRLVARGISTCGSVHSCPLCASRILTVRAQEVTDAVKAHGHARVALVTLTIRHARGESLYALRRLLTDSYAAMKSGRAGGDLKRDLRYVGDIRAAEVTYGQNGWHPHLHALWFVGGKLRQDKMHRALTAAWQAAVRRAHNRVDELIARCLSGEQKSRQAAKAVFGTRYVKPGVSLAEAAREFRKVWATLGGWAELHVPDDAHGVDVAPCDSSETARYISKLGLEVASVLTKTASGRQRTSWQLARDAANGCAQAVVRWAEYGRDMFGSRQLTWSRGLREALACAPERSDTELAADLPQPHEDERIVGVIEAEAWDSRARELGQGWLARLQSAHEAGQLDSLRDVLPVVTPWDTRGPPPRTGPPTWWEAWKHQRAGRDHWPAKPEPLVHWYSMTRYERQVMLAESVLRIRDSGELPPF